jgi:hypothetical protein
VASLATGNSRMVLAISAAFAGPLLYLVEMEGAGIHLRGPSSTGKTTLLRAAVGALRRLAHAGELQVIRIAGKIFTTEAFIADMLAAHATEPVRRCQDLPSQRAFISAERAAVVKPPGSFSPQRARSAQAMALMNAEKLKRRSKGSSPNATDRPPASMTRLTSSLPKP